MADTPYTTRRDSQYRGPQSSEDYNARIEENYKDFVYLYNKIGQTSSDLDRGQSAAIKDVLSLAKTLEKFEQRLQVVEASGNKIGFHLSSQVDTDRFDGSVYEVIDVDKCTWHDLYGILTLPRVDNTSVSKVRLMNSDGSYSVPSSLETFVEQDASTADNEIATIDTSQPYNALTGRPGRIWERNILQNTPYVSGAMGTLYVKIPSELSVSQDTNCITMTPFPIKGVDIMELSYTTDPGPVLNESETWTSFNAALTYYQAPGAAGSLPPGAWDGDEIFDAPPRAFYFDPKPITAIAVKFRQRNYYTEGGRYIYSYGLSKLDVRLDKFLDTGKVIIRFDAPSTDTISTITSIVPQIWNVSEYQLNDVIDTRVIWETAYQSGTYTLNPVSFSKRIWLEVTLRKTSEGGTPALSGLIINYT